MFKSRMKQFTSSKVFHILQVLNILHVLQVLQSYKCSLDCFLAILCWSSPEAALGVSQKVSTTPFELRSRLPRFLTTKSPPPTVSSSIFVSEEMWIFRAAFPESILIIFFNLIYFGNHLMLMSHFLIIFCLEVKRFELGTATPSSWKRLFVVLGSCSRRA